MISFNRNLMKSISKSIKYLYSSKIILSQTNLEDKLHSFISESLETLNKNTRS
jgi:hypothetical protein